MKRSDGDLQQHAGDDDALGIATSVFAEEERRGREERKMFMPAVIARSEAIKGFAPGPATPTAQPECAQLCARPSEGREPVFSLGECTRSSSRPKPTISASILRSRRKRRRSGSIRPKPPSAAACPIPPAARGRDTAFRTERQLQRRACAMRDTRRGNPRAGARGRKSRKASAMALGFCFCRPGGTKISRSPRQAGPSWSP